MIYLYAITDREAAAPATLGLVEKEVQLVKAPEAAGLYSSHQQLEIRAQADMLWRHEQVVEAAMEAAPTLPVRFGTTFENKATLLSLLTREGARLRRQLDAVRGCVELAVRVGLAEAGPDAAASKDGRGYLEAKLVKRHRQEAIVRDALGPLRDWAVRERHAEGRSDSEMICASYLVRSDQVNRFSEQVTLVAERNPELWLSCTGPWPPYSFATAEEAA